MTPLEKYKAAFPRKNSLIHLNNAGLAPTCAPAAEIVRHWIERFQNEGMHCNDEYVAALEVARGQLARFAGASPHEIAFFQSTAGGISQIALGMDLRPGDEILTWEQEFPSNYYPWKAACDRSGAVLRQVPREKDHSTPLEKYLAAVTPKTRVMAFSWVQYQTGALSDLKAIADFARPRGIWTVADVIQGFGLLPFHFHDLGIDAACGGSHKWMTSPVGAGFLMIREDRVSQLQPLIIGAQTYEPCTDPSNNACVPKKGARRFEAGSKQVLEITALGAAAEFLHGIGSAPIIAEVTRLSSRLRDGLTSAGYTMNTSKNANPSIVNFTDKNSAVEIAAKLDSAKISYAHRGPGVRLSPHGFNTDEDIDQVLRVLA